MRTEKLTVAFCCAAMLAIGGCRGAENQTAPPAEATAQTPAMPQNKPMSLTGCLRAGEANDTWLTPWHGVAVKDRDTFRLMRRHEAEGLGARIVELDGRPSYFEL